MRIERAREPVLPVPRIWGGAIALLHHSRRLHPADLVLVLGISGSLLGLIGLAREWHGVMRPAFEEAMPQEDSRRVFETFVRWARYGNLFSYDEERRRLALQ